MHLGTKLALGYSEKRSITLRLQIIIWLQIVNSIYNHMNKGMIGFG